MKFFFDNNLAPTLVEGLKAFGENVMHLTEKFPAETPDVQWLGYIGRKNMVLVTRDLRIRHNPLEITSLKSSKVCAFFLMGKQRGRCELIQQTVRNWPQIKELSQKAKGRPLLYKVPSKGTSIKPYPLS